MIPPTKEEIAARLQLSREVMEQRSYIRSVVWVLVCLAGGAFTYSLGWQQGVDAGQQRGLMQGEMSRSYWEGRAADLRDDDTPPPSDPSKPQRHNAAAGADDSGR